MRHILLITALLTTPASAAEVAWKPIAIDAKFSAWRESEHPGWTQVGDAALEDGAKNRLDGKPGEGVLLSRGDSNLYTQEEFQDLELKLEFMIPAGSNSGVKFNGHYEIQILDSHDRPESELTGSDCGGVYPRADATYQHIDKGSPPKENAALPPGKWQTLEIAFRGPRFDDAGKKTAGARFVEVKLNGKMVQKDVEVKYATGHAWDDVAEVARGPLMLQGDHGPVAFRNIQVRSLAPADDTSTSAVKELRNIPYVENGHRNQVLDLYLPEAKSDKPLPLVIWIHGGAWLGGSHANPAAAKLVEDGFAVASIEYRFSSHAIWPAQAHDCKAAVRYLRANAAQYNLDPDRFAVGGESAGGHLAALLGTSGDVAELEGDLGNSGVSSRVQAVVDLFGPTDLTLMGAQFGPNSMIKHDAPNSPESLLMGGPILERLDLAKTANPLTYIDKSDPPFLILHGDHDQLVPLAQSTILAEALTIVGVANTMQTLAGAGHGGPQFFSPASQDQIKTFLRRHLAAGN